MLDVKDKKILSELIDNSRISKNKLASKVGLSKDVVAYRIKKLEEKGIIIGYQPRLNLNQVFMRYHVLIKFRLYNEKKELEFIEFLKKLKYTRFIAKLVGNYDLLISFIIKDQKDLQSYFNELNLNYSDLIEKVELITRLDEVKHEYDVLFDKRKKYSVQEKEDKTIHKLDETDKKILNELCKNANISTVELAKKLHVTSPAIIYRLKNLKKHNIILRYIAVINICRLEKQFYYIFFDVDLNQDKEKKINQILKEDKNVVFAEKNVGDHPYVSVIAAENNKDFNKILRNLKNKISSMRNLDSALLLDITYQNYCPTNFFD